MNRLLLWLALVVLLALAGYSLYRAGKSAGSRNVPALIAERDAQRRVIVGLRKTAVKQDSVYVVDTIRASSAVAGYRATRDTIRITDTLEVRRALVAADLAIDALKLALSSAEARVAARDTLLTALDTLVLIETRIAEAKRPPRLTSYVDAMYEPIPRVIAASIGAEFRLFRNVSALAGVSSRIPDVSDARAVVGVRWRF